MKNKPIYPPLVFATCILSIGCNLVAPIGDEMEKLEVEITLDQQVYQLDNAIPVSVKVTNTSNADILVNKRMSVNFFGAPSELRDITFVIVGPSGETVPFKARVNIHPTTSGDFITLSPSEIIEKSYRIEIFYDISKIGTYSIFAIYQNVIDANNNNSAWKGEITSNTIIFEIIP